MQSRTCKSLVLTFTMLVATASSVSATIVSDIGSFLKTKDGIALTVVTAAWIRLRSKGTSKWDYKLEDWREDLNELLHSWNLLDAESRATILKLVDKWLIGRQFSLWTKSEKRQLEDGSWVKYTDTVPKSKPFGLMGLFDAYVIFMLGKVIDAAANVAKVHEQFTVGKDDLQTIKDRGFIFGPKN